MTSFIKIGGIAIILAVFAIFFFILIEIIPLFQGARVSPVGQRQGPAGDAVVFGVDEWGRLPFLLQEDGTLHFLPRDQEPFSHRLALAASERITAAAYDQLHQHITVGTSQGRVLRVVLGYQSRLLEDGTTEVLAAPQSAEAYALGEAGLPITAIGFGESHAAKLVTILQEAADGRQRLSAAAFTIARNMLGQVRIEQLWERDLTSLLTGRIDQLLVDGKAEHIVVATADGEVSVFVANDEGVEIFQRGFRPFADLPDPRIASMHYLNGDVSLVFSSVGGANRIWSLFIDPQLQRRQYGQTKVFPDTAGAATVYARSIRNKAFLLASGNQVSLRYATTETVRWQSELPFTVADAVIAGKYDRLLLRAPDGVIHEYALRDPHPEAGLRAFFGKVWYEGRAQPEYEWQSSGATDDFEPKLSLVPLVFGSLKGTFYALLFALPIALLGAVYVSEFMHHRFKIIVKPTIEIMASLPSVVLGFLAALWLAPLVENRVPSVLICLIGLPLGALAFGALWTRLPRAWRSWLRPGYEFLLFAPVMLLIAAVCWQLGPPLERLLFGGDFRQWWPQATGASFEQRNSLVVGFMMGFAVIPIIFTIVEDALSNVPPALRSGSLALGASRWQTAMRIVVPTASAGILSAIMIGFGRAVGETMIVVMATGNTPVMDINIFNGMRTLSANIAVELPEAPHGGTLYRTLFLGAMLLFLLTFVVNTAAEVLRQHLREKYKTV
ncbi:MAG: ABC transporter permease subunit [Planctomycetota bacterium]|nr:ABC transporter permease subunit [Planctomycetota bacterium]